MKDIQDTNANVAMNRTAKYKTTTKYSSIIINEPNQCNNQKEAH